MRTDLTVGDRNLLDSGDYDLHWKFLCDNGSGTAVDLSGRIHGLPTFKPPNPNVPAGEITVALHRELDRTANVSLAPFVEGSTLNRLDDGTTYAVLLEVGRDVTASVAITARGADRPATGYYEVLSGKIGRVDWPKYEGGDVIVFCRDKAGELQKVKSETAYTYAAGISIETAIRETLDNNGYSSVPLHTPTATGKVLSVQHAPGVQKTIWSQVWAFAQSIGWVCWFRYKSDGTVALTLFEPDRDKSVSDFTVAKLRDYNAVGINEDELGNVGRCEYTDSNGVRKTTDPVEDAASISKYGNVRRSFWISLPDDSPVRANADAVALITAAVSDTAHPDTLGELVTPGNPFLECAVDLITVPADGRISDTVRTYAPFSLTVGHPANRDHESRINVRGKPSVGYRTWDAPSKHAVVGDAPETKLLQNLRVRDSADGLSDVITWTNGAKIVADGEVWVGVRTIEGLVTEAELTALAESVESKGLIETFTVAKPTETDGQARVTYVQIEATYTDPATGHPVNSDAWIHKVRPKVHIAAIDPSTGELAETAIEDGMLAAGIDPVRVVSALPADNSDGNIVLLTTDRKLYRWDGSAWTAEVATVDLTGTVATAQIADSAVTAAKIGTGAVETAKMANLAVTEAILAAGAITETKIGAAAVTTAKLANLAVTDAILAAGAVTETKITDLSVSTPKIAAAAVVAGKIATDAVTADKIFAGSVTAVKIATGAIETDKLAANAVTAAKIAANAITAAQIAAGTITTTEIAANTIVAGDIAAGTITTTEIATDTITAGNIAALTITAAEIASNAITTVKLAANAVEADKVAANAITAGKIATDAVTAGTIAAGAVSTDELAANAVTAAKIAAGTITASELAADSVTATKLAAVNIEAGKYIRSTTYTAGSAGWSIDAAGDVEFNNGTFRGEVASGNFTAATATFSGSINTDSIIRTTGEIEIRDPANSLDWVEITYDGTTLAVNQNTGNTLRLGTTSGAASIAVGGGSDASIGFYAVTPVTRQTIAAAATDAATTQTLANDLRTKLINLGLVQA